MISEAENKAMEHASPDSPVTVKAVSPLLNEYHFSGSGQWKPMAVRAASIEAATAIWRSSRQRVTEETSETEGEPDIE